MKPLIVSSLPYTRPDGAKTFSAHLSKVLKTPLFVPKWDDVDITFSSADPAGVTDKEFGDYTILCGPYGEIYLNDRPDRIRWLRSLPRPILMFLHDGENMSSRYNTFWREMLDEVDFFFVSRYNIGNKLGDRKWAHVEYPYVFGHGLPDLRRLKENKIITAGRLVPEKGHRLVAALCKYDYKVVVAGTSGADPKFEQKLYLDDLINSGADTHFDVEKGGIMELARRCKIYMTLGMWPEQECGVEYTALESMSVGCIPIVGKIYERHYREGGLRFFAVESYVEAMPKIDMIFANFDLYAEMVKHNYDVLVNWCSYLPGMIEDTASSIKRNAV